MCPLRHEFNHRISLSDAIILRQRLDAFLERDEHGNNGEYRVRSLYFDTPSDRALREKEDGVARREKFRLRYYGENPGFIRLEKKGKISGMCRKKQEVIDSDQAEALLYPDSFVTVRPGQKLLKEFVDKRAGSGLSAKSVVDYDRTAWVFEPGNVRITIDEDIHSDFPESFLDGQSRPVPCTDEYAVLEVKWDDALPDFIRKLVQLGNRQTSAYSKYEQSRRYF